MSFTKNLFKHSFIYSLSTVIFKATNLFLLPIYTRVLSAEELGTIALLGTFFGLFKTVSFLGSQTGAIRTYLNENDADKKKLVLGTTQWSLMFIVGMISLPPIYFALPITRILGIEEKYAILVAFLFLNNFLRIIKYSRDIYFRVNEFSKKTLFWNNIENLIDLTFSIILVVLLKLGVHGITFAQVAALFFISISFFPWFLKNLRYGFRFFIFKDIYSYGLNFVLLSITSWVLNLSDRWILNEYWGTAAVGFYAIAYRFGSALQLINEGIKTQWGKSLYEMGSREKTAELLISTFMRYLIFSMFIWGIITVYIKEIIHILTPIEYHHVYTIVPIITFGYVLLGLGTIFSAGLHLQRRGKSFWILSTLAGAINIILNFIFIPKYGMTAAAITTAIAFSIQPLGYYWISKMYYPLRLPFKRIITLMFYCLILLLVSIWIGECEFFISIIIKAVVLCTFILFILFSNIITNNDKDELRNLINNYFLNRLNINKK